MRLSIPDRVLVGALAASLALNGILFYFSAESKVAHRPPPGVSEASRYRRTVEKNLDSNVVVESEPSRFPGPKEGEQLAGLVARLRGAGMDESLVELLAGTVGADRYREQTAELFYPRGRQFWEQGGGVLQSQLDPFERARVAELTAALGRPVIWKNEALRVMEAHVVEQSASRGP